MNITGKVFFYSLVRLCWNLRRFISLMISHQYTKIHRYFSSISHQYAWWISMNLWCIVGISRQWDLEVAVEVHHLKRPRPIGLLTALHPHVRIKWLVEDILRNSSKFLAFKIFCHQWLFVGFGFYHLNIYPGSSCPLAQSPEWMVFQLCCHLNQNYPIKLQCELRYGSKLGYSYMMW